LDAWTATPLGEERDVFAAPEEEPDDTFEEPDHTFGTVLDTEPDDIKTAPTEFESTPNGTPAQVEQLDDGSIPPCLRRCEQSSDDTAPARYAGADAISLQ
jgi:hypothetical protein